MKVAAIGKFNGLAELKLALLAHFCGEIPNAIAEPLEQVEGVDCGIIVEAQFEELVGLTVLGSEVEIKSKEAAQ